MPASLLGPYSRTILAAAVLLVTLGFALSGARGEVHTGLLPFFEWLETTWFGVAGKTWGAVFATVQSVHLLGLALLGGAVLAAEGRLLNVILTDTPRELVCGRCNRVFDIAMIALVATGVFMACGVAVKIYYLPVYWYKMLGLAAGALFHYFVRNPVLAQDLGNVNPWLLKTMAVASIMVWFTVAATGRWIGFSG